MADFKFPKDDRFADYAALVAPAQVQQTEVPFDDEVSTDFKSISDRERIADMYDQDRASEVAIANEALKSQTDKWNSMLDEINKVRARKMVEDKVRNKVSRKPASKQPEGPTPEEVRKVLAQDPKPELDDADSYDRAYEGRQIEEANKTVQAANAPKDGKKELSDRELLQQARKELKEGYQKDRDAQLYATIANALGKIGAASGAARAGVKADLSSGFDYKPVSSYAQEAKDSYQQLLKEYQALNKSKDGMTPYQKKSLALQEKRLNLQKGKEGRLSKKTDKAIEKQEELSDKEVKDISAFDDGMRIVDNIDNLLKDTDIEKDLGPYASRFEEASRLVPGLERDEDFVKMQQLIGIQLADYVKSISGAQVSEEEAQRLLKNIPNMSDKPKSFKAKLGQFRDKLEKSQQNYIKNIGKQKEGAEKFVKKPNNVKEVKRRTKDGRVAIFDADTKQFLRYEE